MATNAQIRSALATALDAISDVQAYPYVVSSPLPPCMVVSGPRIEYDQAMGRGHDDVFFVITAYAALTTDQGAQKKLDLWTAPSGAASVKAVVEADRTLGGIVDFVRVTEATDERVYQPAGGGPLLGREWTVYVLNPGT